jgi:hypothetical protein
VRDTIGWDDVFDEIALGDEERPGPEKGQGQDALVVLVDAFLLGAR